MDMSLARYLFGRLSILLGIVAVGLVLAFCPPAGAEAVVCGSSGTTQTTASPCITDAQVTSDWTGTVLPAAGGCLLVVGGVCAGVYLLVDWSHKAVDHS